MKLHNILYFLVTSLGMVAAMSVALHDTVTGIAVGVGVAIAFTYSDNKVCGAQKSHPEHE